MRLSLLLLSFDFRLYCWFACFGMDQGLKAIVGAGLVCNEGLEGEMMVVFRLFVFGGDDICLQLEGGGKIN